MRIFEQAEADWVNMRFNFTDHREHFEVNAGDLVTPLPTVAEGDPPPPDARKVARKEAAFDGTEPCGTHNFDLETKKEVDVLVNGKVPAEIKDT